LVVEDSKHPSLFLRWWNWPAYLPVAVVAIRSSPSAGFALATRPLTRSFAVFARFRHFRARLAVPTQRPDNVEEHEREEFEVRLRDHGGR